MKGAARRTGLIVAVFLLAPLARGADADATQAAPTPAENDADSPSFFTEEVTVTGNREDAQLQPGSVLKGDALRKQLGSTLGETLESELGVHNASFGPGVGLPVIRGMSGPRVQVLQGALGSHDASSVSPDHAVAIEGLLAEEIEVHRGPGTLRYGGSAMGGAVNIKVGRIPESRPERRFDGAIETRYDENPNYSASVFKVDAGAGPVVVHLDGFLRDGNGIEIPGEALDEAAVIEQFGDLAQFENTDGFVANSDTSGSGLSLGSSLVFDRGFVGIAVNKQDNAYGIPPGGVPPHSDDPTVVQPTPENLRIDMAATRWDGAARLDQPLPFVESISMWAANVDYEHVELARDLPSTRFESLATDARFELAHRFSDAWNGTVGYQWIDQEFGATGVESFIPTSDIQTRAAYLIESVAFGRLTFELAFRREDTTITPQDDTRIVAGTEVDLPDRYDFTARSSAIAVQLALTDQLGLRFGMTRGERNPAIQEAMSLGPHFATRSYAIGNRELEIEQGTNLDVSLAYRSNAVDLDVSVYRNKIDNYIYQENLGVVYNIDTRLFQVRCVDISDCLPVYGYFQQDAEFLGYEAELRFRLPILFGIGSEIGLFSDYVRAYFTEDGAGDVPRLPPRRAGVVAAARWQAMDLQARWTHGFAQERPGLNETETDGYNRVDVEFSYSRPMKYGENALLFMKGKNLTDAEIRHATSFLRNFAPEQGRSVEAGIRWTF